MNEAAATHEFVKFLFVGACNTLVAYAAYLLLATMYPYPVAWGIAYVLGIGTGYLANSLFVFKKPFRRRSALAYCGVYVGQYLVGIALLKLFLEVFGLPHWLSALTVIALTVPLTFVFVRYVMNSR